MNKVENISYFTLKGGTLLHPESLMVKDAILLYFKGTFFSPLRYSVSIPLDQIKSVQSNPDDNDIVIKSNSYTLTCHRFSRKKLSKLLDLIENSA